MPGTLIVLDQQKGASLIEVLVAVFVLALGLLGLAGLQVKATQLNESSLQRSQAVMLSYLIIDAMRIDFYVAESGGYNMSSPQCSVPSGGGTLAGSFKQSWMQALKNNLGNTNATCGQVQCDASANCTVSVFWNDSRSGGSAQQSIETRTRL